VNWAEGLEALDDAPLYVVANEFLDSRFRLHQFIRSSEGWCARMVGEESNALVFATGEAIADDIFPATRMRPWAMLSKLNTEAVAAMRTISHRIVRSGGVGLVVDYGHDEQGLGDTFQAV
jgi:SAM-dependent MidA family methyltransferase